MNPRPGPSLVIERHLTPDDLVTGLREDARRGLSTTPKWLPPKWFYDEEGSRLFDEITRLPEYYPTRRETEILTTHAGDIAATTGASVLIELGSGTSTKTRLLLDALTQAGSLELFVPFDVSAETLEAAGRSIGTAYPGLDVHAVVGDFERHLDEIGPFEPAGPRLLAFLGSTIGNFEPSARERFLAATGKLLRSGDWLLLGTDLVKDPDRLVAAYDDAAGVTAAFNRNVLRVLNQALDGNLDPDRFAHVAVWDAENEWIEMRLRAEGSQRGRLEVIDLDVGFEDGEEMRTEISAKFRRDGVAAELDKVGLDTVRWWTDPAGDFGLTLARKTGSS